MSCGVDRRRGSDPLLLWLWCRPVGYSSDSTRSLGTSICRKCGSKKTKKKSKKKKEEEKENPEGLSTRGVLV